MQTLPQLLAITGQIPRPEQMAITKTDSFIQDGERYDIDRQLCWAKGSTWAQVDTDQDAWYYGNWANQPVAQPVVAAYPADQRRAPRTRRGTPGAPRQPTSPF